MERITVMKVWVLNVFLGLLGVVSLFSGDENFAWYTFPLLLCYLLIAPGVVLLQAIGFELRFDLKRIIYSVSLSMLFLYLSGLFINYVIPEISHSVVPLSPESLRVRIFSIFMPLLILVSTRTWNAEIPLPAIQMSWQSIGLTIVGIAMPIIGVMGAFTLNAGMGNGMVFALMGMVLLMFGILSFWEKPGLYPWIVWSVALSLLWMLSFRSAYPVGWDIAEEMAVFYRTQQFGRWMPVVFNPAYNACLSITILPTIYSAFLPFTNAAIYKIVYPAVFSLVAVSGYLLGKRILGEKVAFLGVFYMMAQPLFIQPMVGLARQMMALVFFAGLLLNLFSEEADTKSSKVLNYLLATGMVLSHYSTTYIAIFYFLMTYIITLIYRNTYQEHDILRTLYSWLRLKSDDGFSRRISFTLIGYMVILTVGWYSQVNQSGTGVVRIITRTVQSLGDIFVQEAKTGEAEKAVTVFAENDYEEKIGVVDDFVASNESFFDNTDVKTSTGDTYQVTYLPEKLATGVMQGTSARTTIRVFEFIKTIMKLMVPFGSVLLVWVLFRTSKYYKEFIVLCVVANLMITIILFHPTLGAFYNVTRLSIQGLLFLSLVAVFGVFTLTSRMHKWLQTGLVYGLVMSVFCLNYGVLGWFTGGFPFMQLYNYGDDYNKFYYHESELAGARWLRGHKAFSTPVFTDTIGNLRLMMGGQVRGLPSVLPSVVYDKSYVYLRTLSVKENRYSTSYGGQSFSYTFSQQFYDENKNLVYRNAGSKIYR